MVSMDFLCIPEGRGCSFQFGSEEEASLRTLNLVLVFAVVAYISVMKEQILYVPRRKTKGIDRLESPN